MNDSFNILTRRSRTWILFDWHVERAQAKLTSSYAHDIDIGCKHKRRVYFYSYFHIAEDEIRVTKRWPHALQYYVRRDDFYVLSERIPWVV